MASEISYVDRDVLIDAVKRDAAEASADDAERAEIQRLRAELSVKEKELAELQERLSTKLSAPYMESVYHEGTNTWRMVPAHTLKPRTE